jgi:hypothetical protein
VLRTEWNARESCYKKKLTDVDFQLKRSLPIMQPVERAALWTFYCGLAFIPPLASLSPSLIASASVMYLPFFVFP